MAVRIAGGTIEATLVDGEAMTIRIAAATGKLTSGREAAGVNVGCHPPSPSAHRRQLNRTPVAPAMSVIEPKPVAKLAAAPSQQSLLALSWLNFFLSGMQVAFGPIAAAYLAAQGWTARDIGFDLSTTRRMVMTTAGWFAGWSGGNLLPRRRRLPLARVSRLPESTKRKLAADKPFGIPPPHLFEA